MALKNYTTQVPASRSIAEITEALVRLGATGVGIRYDKGLACGLTFQVELGGRSVIYELPAAWPAFKRALALTYKIKRAAPESDDARAYAHRVAWRCIRDWVLAQAALIETEMVDSATVFLPYATTDNGQTVAARMLKVVEYGGDQQLQLPWPHADQD